MESSYIIAIAPSLNAWLLHMFPLHLLLLKYLLNDVNVNVNVAIERTNIHVLFT